MARKPEVKKAILQLKGMDVQLGRIEDQEARVCITMIQQILIDLLENY